MQGLGSFIEFGNIRCLNLLTKKVGGLVVIYVWGNNLYI